MRLAPTVALLAVLVVAGCVGPSGPVTGTDGPAADSATHQATTTTATEAQSPTAPADGTDANTVAYENLDEHQQAAADAAIEREIQFVPDSPYVSEDEGFRYALIDPFENNEYVVKNGSYYGIELRQMTGDLYASYEISATPSEPGPNETVRPLSDLPADVRDEVRWAVENGSHYVPTGKWYSLPESLQETDYVRYENETYSLGYTVGDFWASEMRLERVD